MMNNQTKNKKFFIYKVLLSVLVSFIGVNFLLKAHYIDTPAKLAFKSQMFIAQVFNLSGPQQEQDSTKEELAERGPIILDSSDVVIKTIYADDCIDVPYQGPNKECKGMNFRVCYSEEHELYKKEKNEVISAEEMVGYCQRALVGSQAVEKEEIIENKQKIKF